MKFNMVADVSSESPEPFQHNKFVDKKIRKNCNEWAGLIYSNVFYCITTILLGCSQWNDIYAVFLVSFTAVNHKWLLQMKLFQPYTLQPWTYYKVSDPLSIVRIITNSQCPQSWNFQSWKKIRFFVWIHLLEKTVWDWNKFQKSKWYFYANLLHYGFWNVKKNWTFSMKSFKNL